MEYQLDKKKLKKQIAHAKIKHLKKILLIKHELYIKIKPKTKNGHKTAQNKCKISST